MTADCGASCRLSQHGASGDDVEVDLPPGLSQEERDLALKRARNRSATSHDFESRLSGSHLIHDPAPQTVTCHLL